MVLEADVCEEYMEIGDSFVSVNEGYLYNHLISL